MGTYNLEEQEKIDQIKSWWNKYSIVITIILTASLVTIGGTQAWKYYQQKQAYQAADLYFLLEGVKESGNAEKINDAAHLLTEGFPSSGYASRAAIISAQSDVQSGNNKRAIQSLQWIIDHAKEPALHDLARLRIAGILLDEERYEEAIKTLNTQDNETFAGLYLDRKGDILSALNKNSEARLSYQAALEKLSKSNNYYNIVQMKLDALGESD